MRLLRSHTIATLLLCIAFLAPSSTGNPLPPNYSLKDVASRSLIESAANFPGSMLNADDTVQHPPLRPWEKRTNGLKLTYAYPFKSIMASPVQSLVYFYNAIAIKSLGALGNAQPTDVVHFTLGNLRLLA